MSAYWLGPGLIAVIAAGLLLSDTATDTAAPAATASNGVRAGTGASVPGTVSRSGDATEASASPPAPKAADGPIVIENCIVSLVEDVDVPSEAAGKLVELAVRHGAVVQPGDLLARLDDRDALVQRTIAQIEEEISRHEAENDVRLRATEAAAAVAEAEHIEVLDINREVADAIPQVRVRRLQLSRAQSLLQVEVAQLELRLAALQNGLLAARLEAAARAVERTRIEAPISGVVVKLYHETGEWVAPGEPIARVVRIDRLRVEGFLPAVDYPPAEMLGRGVTVVVRSANEDVELPGEIEFCSPLVEPTGEYRLWCEIENPPHAAGRRLQPGLAATMRLARE